MVDTKEPSCSLFADDYELFIDHGNGQKTKVKEDHKIFRDIEQFLLTRSDLFASKEPRKVETTVSIDDAFNDGMEKTKIATESSVHALSSAAAAISCNISFYRSWSSNKSSNPQVTCSQVETKPLNNQRQSQLGLRIAVNGVSKSCRSSIIPSKNTNLMRGDFGDDAGTIIRTEQICFLGLADGAGGNRALGLDPADFSRALLAACNEILQVKSHKSHELPDLVLAALRKIKASTIRGSGTLCLLALDRSEKTLTSLNIGDSGYVIYRENRLYHRSRCTRDPHRGDPRQLFALDDIFGLPSLDTKKDLLSQSSVEHIPVKAGDLIILSSDGLWDVIDIDQLETIVQDHRNLPNLADALLKFAINGYTADSRDDILIIVGQIEEY